MKRYLLGIDAGTTASKVVIFDETGTIIASSTIASSNRMQVVQQGIGFEEFDVQELWDLIAKCIKITIQKSKIEPQSILGLGVTSFGNGVVFLDESGNAIAPGCFSQDYRANDMIAMYKQSGTYEKINKIVRGTLFAGEPGPILRWYKEYRRDVYDRIGKIFMLKDYIMYRLTGEFVTDANVFGGSFMTDMDTGEYSKELFDLYGIEELYGKLPRLYEHPEDIIGSVTKEAAEITGLAEGTFVAAGMMDILSSLVGVGGTGEGVITAIAGSWCINETHSSKIIENASSNMPYLHKKEYLNCSYTGASATNYEWFIQNLGDKAKLTAVYEGKNFYEVFDQFIEQVAIKKDLPYFQPFIAAPSIHINATAGFSNISAHTSYEELCYAVVEGIAFIHKYHIQLLLDAGLPGTLIRLTGGMAKSNVWGQMFTDIMQIPVEIVDCDETGALGVALAAGIGVKVYSDYEDAFKKGVKIKLQLEPNDAKKEFYQERYQEWMTLNTCLLRYWEENKKLV